jgi:Uma2 family endonuclease
MSITSHLTAEQFLGLPLDGQRFELIEGELRAMSPAGSEHGKIIWDLAVELGQFIKRNRLGQGFDSETGYLLSRDPDTVRSADISFVTRERLERIGVPQGFFPGAPDLAVEVVSPSDRASDVEEKVAAWLRHGTREVWVLRPRQRTVTVHRSSTEVMHLTQDDALESPDLLPGFQLAVRDVFPSV